MLPSVGWPEMAILFVIVLIIFGPKSLPKIGKALGRGIREFKGAARGLTNMDDDDDDEELAKPKPVAAKPQVSQADATVASEAQASENHV